MDRPDTEHPSGVPFYSLRLINGSEYAVLFAILIRLLQFIGYCIDWLGQH